MPATQSEILDALLGFRLESPSFRWNFPLAIGTPISAPGGVGQAVSLTFSFRSTLPSYDARQGITDFTALTSGPAERRTRGIFALQQYRQCHLDGIRYAGHCQHRTGPEYQRLCVTARRGRLHAASFLQLRF